MERKKRTRNKRKLEKGAFELLDARNCDRRKRQKKLMRRRYELSGLELKSGVALKW